MTDTERTPREECYHALRNEFSSAIASHLRKHPERLNDPELERDLKALMVLMLNVIKLLDRYELGRRERHGRQLDEERT